MGSERCDVLTCGERRSAACRPARGHTAPGHQSGERKAEELLAEVHLRIEASKVGFQVKR